MKSIKVFFAIYCFCSSVAVAQLYNSNSNIASINYDVPKSPESASFEKYGRVPIGEYTGTASVDIPIFAMRNSGMELPINLTYHSSGIKVSQEATWVGLGWDLVPGGRVTLQIRGGYDRYTDQYYKSGTWGTKAETMMKYMMSQVERFPRYGSVAWACDKSVRPPGPWPPDPALQDPNKYCDYWQYHPTLNFSAWDLMEFLYLTGKHAALEPDIYHVSFLGGSLSFFKQPFTNKIIVMNENNLYKIDEITENDGYSGWRIIDDKGIQYIFSQEEKTYYRTPLHGKYPELTTSWLLTQIVALNSEVINFTYANYGEQFLAPEIIESKTTWASERPNPLEEVNSNKDNPNEFFSVKSQYLSQIESKNTVVSFHLGFRDDIGGLGARKLEEIVIKSKTTDKNIKKIRFNYEYFDSAPTLDYPFYINPSLLNVTSHGNTTAEQRLSQRLKLVSVDVGGWTPSIYEQSYRFLYNPLLLPNKVSTSQDHWGYFNGANNINPNPGALSFAPSLQSLVEEGLLMPSYPIGTDVSLSGHANRRADTMKSQASILTSVIYPTGGYTNFEYELHQSYLSDSAPNLIGGGLRIKRISNFSTNNDIESFNDFSYINEAGKTSGTYLGSIDYLSALITFYHKDLSNKSEVTRTILSGGNLNMAGSTVGYGEVTKTFIDYKSPANNYSTVKYFNVRSSYPVTSYGGGTPAADASFVPWFLHLPPTPASYTAGLGKLVSEKNFNNQGEIVQSKSFFYKENLVLDTLYSMNIRQCTVEDDEGGFNPVFRFVFEPIRSYFTTVDSTITETYYPERSVRVKTEMEYNNFFQLEKEINSSSDKGTSIQYVSTPLSYPFLSNYQSLLDNNIVNVPIEKIWAKKDVNQIEYVIAAVNNKYDGNANVLEISELNVSEPIPINNFQKSHYGTVGGIGDIIFDSRYEVKQTALYYPYSNLLMQLTKNGQSQSLIYDPVNENLLALAVNSKHPDIAYTSFEDNDKGGWTLDGGSISDLLAHTGLKCFYLNNETKISKTIVSSGVYIVSYWSNSNELKVNGTSSEILQTIGDWTYQQHKVTFPSYGTIEIVGVGNIDELRLYPSDSQLTSYTYQPLVGITTSTDPKSLSTYFEYDSFNRLKYIRNYKRDINKVINYNYIDINGIIPAKIYFSSELSGFRQKNNCETGQTGNVIKYTIPLAKYYSFISQHDANQKAQDDFNINAQINANNLGSCTTDIVRPTFNLEYYFDNQSEFLITIRPIGSPNGEDYVVSGNGSLSNIPGGDCNVTINELTYTGMYDFYLDNLVEEGVYVHFSNVTLNGTKSLVILQK